MKKIYVTVIILALFILALSTKVTASPASAITGDWPYPPPPGSVYIPYVAKDVVPTLVPTAIPTLVPTAIPTATLVPTVAPTATKIPTVAPTAIPYSPIPVGTGIHFKGWENDTHLSGVVVKAEFKQSLVDYWGDTYYPAGGTFLIVIMDVTNNGLVSDSVGMFSSFRVKDADGRQFDLADDVYIQMAGSDLYNLKGVYDTIQPGFTVREVFVFDVLPSQYFTLVSLSSW